MEVKDGKSNRRKSLYDKKVRREALTKWVADFTGVQLLCGLMGAKGRTVQNKSDAAGQNIRGQSFKEHTFITVGPFDRLRTKQNRDLQKCQKITILYSFFGLPILDFVKFQNR